MFGKKLIAGLSAAAMAVTGLVGVASADNELPVIPIGPVPLDVELYVYTDLEMTKSFDKGQLSLEVYDAENKLFYSTTGEDQCQYSFPVSVSGEYTAVLSSSGYETRYVYMDVDVDDRSYTTEGVPILLRKGDINGDGEVKVNDILMLIQVVKGKVDAPEKDSYYYNVDNVVKDSALNTKDIMKLIQAVNGKIKM